MLRRGIALAITAGSLLLTSGQPGETRVVAPRGGEGGPPQTLYPATSKEHYLSKEDFDFLRPGLNTTIVSVSNVAPGQNPIVEVQFTDDLGQPLDRNGVLTPGAIQAEFILGAWNAPAYEYVNLTTVTFGGLTLPLHDIGGTWQDVAVGDSKYTFKTALPATFDVTQTVTLGIYSGRNTQDFIGKNFNAPAALKTFRPDGRTAIPVFASLDTQSCNSCHDPLQFHGQFGPPIEDVKLCVMCHTSQMPTFPTGETLDFKILIHKLHDASNLPSVKAGTPYAPVPGEDDFSTVVFPQDIRNCAKCHAPLASTPDSPNWFTRPARAACGSCHDDVNFATGANHPAGPYSDDSACANCHAPQGDHEWDASIRGAHTVPTKSAQLKGLSLNIVSVTNTAPGQNPTVVFQATNGDGSAVDPSTLGNAFLVLSGPTTDYGTVPFSLFESVKKATFDGTNATFTATNAIPANATGSWAVALSALRSVPLKPAPRLGPANVSESALNPVTYVAVTDPQPVARRTVVNRDNCNACHDDLALHGRNFKNTFMCVMCHNPNGDDSSQRPVAKLPPESIDFKRMIHRIHTGEDLAQDYTIYGFQSSVHNFNDVRFPGDRRDCLKCHANTDTYQIPEDDALATRLPTNTPRDWYTPMQPVATACLGCHSEKHQAAHAFQMTAPFGEACMACHAPDAFFSVDKVHAR